MWNKIAFLFVFLFVAGVSSVMAQDREYTIKVSGEAVRAVVPDKVLINVTVQSEAKKQVGAVEAQALKSQALMAALRKLGVADKDVSTTGYTYGPVYDYNQSQSKNVLRGYQAVQSLTVKANREKAASLVDEVSALAEVNGVSFFVSNAKELHEELVNSAIDDAKARAAKRAQRLEVTLGSIVAYQESSSGSAPPPRAAMARASAMADSAPELPAGETEFRVTVSVTYKLVVP